MSESTYDMKEENNKPANAVEHNDVGKCMQSDADPQISLFHQTLMMLPSAHQNTESLTRITRAMPWPMNEHYSRQTEEALNDMLVLATPCDKRTILFPDSHLCLPNQTPTRE